jgi:hypothetical protein
MSRPKWYYCTWLARGLHGAFNIIYLIAQIVRCCARFRVTFAPTLHYCHPTLICHVALLRSHVNVLRCTMLSCGQRRRAAAALERTHRPSWVCQVHGHRAVCGWRAAASEERRCRGQRPNLVLDRCNVCNCTPSRSHRSASQRM